MPEQINCGSPVDDWAAQLADLDEQAEAGQQPLPADETIVSLKAQLDTFVATLRREPQPGDFDRETGCERVTDWVRAIGRNPEELREQLVDRGSDPRSMALALDSVPLGTIGAYELISKLGEGGMGAVYKARHTRLDKIVAIKVLPAERMKDTAAVARFEREMRAVGRLEHPNIVRAMDAGEAGGVHYLVMEYVQGIDLSQLVKQHGPLRIADACELIRQAAIGLDEAHHNQMVHRDIKPSNIMLCEVSKRKPPVVKILDMGLALLSEAHSADVQGLTSTGQVMGTLDYMAPEQGGDSKSVDIRADIYALGATLYKLLCGEAIYHGENYQTPVQKLMAQAIQPAPPIQQRRKGVPDELAAVLHRMLEKNPDDRIATPDDVAKSLAPYSAGANLATLLNHVGLDVAPTPDTSISETTPTFLPTDADTGVAAASTKTTPTTGVSKARVQAPASIPPSAARAQSAAKASHGRRLPPWVPSVVGGGLLGAGGIAALLVAAVFFFQTPHGMVRVEIKDPDVKVEVMASGIVVTEKDEEPVTVEAGDHTLKISRGDFSFTTDAFTVTKGEEVVVKIERLDATIKVSKADGSLLGKGTDERVAVFGGGGLPGEDRAEEGNDSNGLPRGGIKAIDTSPDGKLIAASFSAGELALVDSTTFEVKSLVGDGTAITNPHWSPDGRFLAVAVGDELQILNADGTVAARVLGAPLQFFEWHPTSRWLVTGSTQHGRSRVWFVNPETSKTVNQDGEVPGGLGGMEWSADRKQLLVSCSWGIVIFDEDGNVAEKIPHPGLLLATWHPDGEHFLVARSAGPTRQIALIDRKGTVVETQHDIGRGLTNFMADPELGILEVASDVIRYGWKGANQKFGVHGLFAQRHNVQKRPGAVAGYGILSPKLEHAPLLPHVIDIGDDGTPRPPRQFNVVSNAIAWNADGTELLAAPQRARSEGALVALDPKTGEVIRTLGRPNPEWWPIATVEPKPMPERSVFDDLKRKDIDPAELNAAEGESRIPELVAILGDSRFRPDDHVLGITFDGPAMMATTTAGKVTWWSTENGRPIESMAGPGISVADGDSRISIVDGGGRSKIVVREGNDAIIRLSIDLTEPWTAMTLAADGSMVVVGWKNGAVGGWSTKTGKPLFQTHPAEDANGADVKSIVIAPGGETMAVCRSGQNVSIRSMANGDEPRALNVVTSTVAFTSDGKRIATSADGTVVVWNVETGEAIAATPGGKPVIGLAFSPDGKRLAAVTADSIGLWSLAEMKLERTIAARHLAGPVAFSPDSDTLVAAVESFSEKGYGYASLGLWNPETGETRFQRIGPSGMPTALHLSDEGNVIVAAVDSSLTWWNVADRLLERTSQPSLPTVLDAEFSADGGGCVFGQEGRLTLWDVVRDREVTTFVGRDLNGARMSVNKDGRLVAAQALIDLHANTERFKAPGKELVLSPAGDVLITAIREGIVGIDLFTGEELAPVLDAQSGVRRMAFSPDGRTLVEALPNGSVSLRETKTMTRTRLLLGNTNPVVDLVFTRDSRLVAALTSSSIVVWNLGESRPAPAAVIPLATPFVQASFQGVENNVAFEFSPEGRHLLLGRSNGTVQVFRIPGG